MVNVNKVILSMFLVMMLMSFCVKCYSSEKPSEEVMKSIVVNLELQLNDPIYKAIRTDFRLPKFNITNSFLSKKNGRYCISVNYDLSYRVFMPENQKSPPFVINKVDGRYSFDKKGDKWYGWEGWGPGE